MTEFVLLPGQKRYYMSEDLAVITRIAWRIALITTAALFVLLTIVAIAKKFLGWGIIYAVFVCAFLAFLFQPFFETATLYVNRKVHSVAIQRRFVVVTWTGDTARNDLFLCEPSTKKSLLDSLSYAFLPATSVRHWHKGDTIDVTVYRGLFGVPWFQIP